MSSEGKNVNIYIVALKFFISLTMLEALYIAVIGSPVRDGAIIDAVFVTAVVIVAFKFGVELGSSLEKKFSNFPELGTVVSNAIYIATIWMAYFLFSGIIYPFSQEAQQLVSLIFVVITIPLLIKLASNVANSFGKWSGSSQGRKVGIKDSLVCPNCKKQIASDSRFCNYCGASIVEVKPPPAIETEEAK
jgi:hypothetical protein